MTPFDTDGFSARWKLDEAPGLVLFNASNFLLHCFVPSIFIRSLNGLFGILIGGFDGGIKYFEGVLNGMVRGGLDNWDGVARGVLNLD